MPTTRDFLNDVTLQNVLTEQDLCELLAAKKEQISALRARGLPFIKLGQRTRLYFEKDLLAFFLHNRKILNRVGNADLFGGDRDE